MAVRADRGDGKARVFSYVRFSTPEQAMGDSERRQVEAAQNFAKRNGLELDQSLQPDRGLSGFHGHHRSRGHLGRFLEAVEAGTVPPGSLLLVENIDRLGREGVVDALETIVSGLIRHGITIETIYPPGTYNRKSLDEGRIWELIAHVNRAHAESKRKSDLGQASWNQKRRLAHGEKRVLTGRVPAWLKVTWDRTDPQRPKVKKLEPIPEAVEAIRFIFDQKLKGLVGLRTIEGKLNSGKWWLPPKSPKRKGEGWRTTYIKKILSNPAVIGHYQPHERTTGKRKPVGDPIPDYFPVIVKPEVFHAVQGLLAVNRGKGGRIERGKNLFQHLVKCAYCHGTMAFIDKGKGRKGGWYLYCDSGRRGVRGEDGQPRCKRHSIRYDECERLILENCPRLRPDQVLPDPGKQAEKCRAIRQRLQGHDGELAATERGIDNLVDQVAITDDATIRAKYEAKIKALSDQKVTIEAKRQADETELAKAERSLQSFEGWQRNLETLLKGLKRKKDVDLRLRLRGHLRELIDRVEVFAVGHPYLYDPDRPLPPRKKGEDPAKYRARCRIEEGDSFASGLFESLTENPRLRRNKQFRSFIEFIARERMSKRGRFLRVFFKSGAKVDLVPPGSLASGMAMVKDRRRKDGWRFLSPALDQLFREFLKLPGISNRLQL